MYPSAWSRFVLEMYPGFVVIRNGKTHRNACHEEEVYTHGSLETGGAASHKGPHGERPGWSGGREGEATAGPEPFNGFPQAGMGAAGR